jgi:hypothetical protein
MFLWFATSAFATSSADGTAFARNRAGTEMYPSTARRLWFDCCDCTDFASIVRSGKLFSCHCPVLQSWRVRRSLGREIPQGRPGQALTFHSRAQGYQTSAGVEADLPRSLAKWESNGRIEAPYEKRSVSRPGLRHAGRTPRGTRFASPTRQSSSPAGLRWPHRPPRHIANAPRAYSASAARYRPGVQLSCRAA